MKDQAEKQMIVGYGITVEGRIDNCDRLILDGNMNCELSDLKSLIISNSGLFKGKGNVQEAEISGRFEGELVVDGHITIMETGKVDGKITYRSIEIKPGGKFTGEIILQETPKKDKDKKASDDKTAEGPDFLDQALKGRIMEPSDAKSTSE
jgi:cytoskeletal protein CcmA (bactofilin family)